ncbi:hypothetical protein BJY52DRAFT_1304157 [Lactarius psammicola]|nr:hypothetical protein BJY52DRAFT_1304157 [Lactarius psammicola]
MLGPPVPASRSTPTSDSPTDCAASPTTDSDHPPSALNGWSMGNLHIWDSSQAQNLLRGFTHSTSGYLAPRRTFVWVTTTSTCSLYGPSDGETRTGPIPARIQSYLVRERVSKEWGRTTDSEGETPATTVHTCPLCDRIVHHPRCLFATFSSPSFGVCQCKWSSEAKDHGCYRQITPRIFHDEDLSLNHLVCARAHGVAKRINYGGHCHVTPRTFHG